MPLPYLIIADWGNGGHNADYLCAYASACRSLGFAVELVTTPKLAEQVKQLQTYCSDELSYPIHQVSWPSFTPVRPRSLQRTLRRRSYAREITLAIYRISRRLKEKPSAIIFTTVLEVDFDILNYVTNDQQIPWLFLYLHPHQFVGQGSDKDGFASDRTHAYVLRKPNLLGIATLNEDLVDPISTFCGKPVLAFPDVSDNSSVSSHPLCTRFRAFAGNRMLVVLVGNLMPWKGAALLAESCLEMDPNRFAFLFCGQLDLGSYSDRDANLMHRCLSHAPNAIFHLSRLPDATAYNAVIQSADVIYSVYENWPFSSNTLTKAAHFRKPIIVGDQGLPAKRVSEYKLGVATAFRTSEVKKAIEFYESKDRIKQFQDEGSFDEYLEVHNPSRLAMGIKRLLEGHLPK